jgi:hypothetical protein
LLRRHIMLPQIPRLALMRRLLQNSGHENITSMHMDLLASATCNSAGASSAPSRRRRMKKSHMADRIRNCITIASHLSLPKNSSFADPNTKPVDLMRHLYTAALSSTYCRQYMYMPTQCTDWFQNVAEGDAYLEAALLIACGYMAESVLHTMSRLVNGGILPRYRVSVHRSGIFWQEDMDVYAQM